VSIAPWRTGVGCSGAYRRRHADGIHRTGGHGVSHGRTLGRRRSRRDRLQPHGEPKAEAWCGRAWRRRRAARRGGGPGAELVCGLRRRDDDVAACARARGPGCWPGSPRAPCWSITRTASAALARELERAARDRASVSSMRRSPGARPAPRRARSRSWSGGEEGAFERALPALEPLRALRPAARSRGSGQLTKMVNQICIAGVLRVSPRVSPSRSGRSRRGGGGRRDQQGRGAVLADGEPQRDHDRGPLRLRLRRRLDAQGSRHRPRRGPPQWRPAAAHGARRSVLRGRQAAGRRALGHLVAAWSGACASADAGEPSGCDQR
jgi:hypothetical protein